MGNMAVYLERVRDFLYLFQKKTDALPATARLREQAMEKSSYPTDQRVVFFRIDKRGLRGRCCNHCRRSCGFLRVERGAFDAALEN